MRSLLVSSALTLTLTLMPSASSAQTPSPQKLALAEKVLAVMRDEAEEATASQQATKQDARKVALRKRLPNATSASITSAVEAEARFEADAIFQENKRIYAARFTEAELNDMLTFYTSPGGRALVAGSPAILA